MSGGPRAGVAGVVILGAALAACATVPARVTPTMRQAAVATHQQRAAAAEGDGRLRSALDHWEVVLTIDPDHGAARQARQRLQARIAEALAERLRQGRAALDRGLPFEARRHFLAALALDPSNEVAFEALRSEIPDYRWVVHTVRRGETLATLATRYYGHAKRADVIRELNQLPPNPRLAAGTTLRIPEIPGHPFLTPESRPRAREEPREAHPLLLEARDALERRDYAQARASLDRLLASQPQNPEGLDLKKAVLYNLGRSQLEQQRWAESYQTLNQLAKLGPSYQDVPSLLRQARNRLVQQHYSQGLRFFRDEKLEEAIAEWRIVVEVDPQHVNARRNLAQAERLLKSLEERRKRPSETAPKN